jgi:GTP-binding protein HflX
VFFDRPESGQHAVLVHVRFSRLDEDDEIAEFTDLVRSAALGIASLVLARRSEPQSRSFVGRGKCEEITRALKEAGADLVIFNHELSPSQQRNLEQLFECRVVTRTELILWIFAQRARTHEGKLQVELAQLKHAQTRLVRGWTHLDRQKGGIGLRGAGETQLELDQRMLTQRIRSIDARLEKVRQQRRQGRRKRDRAAVPTVALVGYTNAGKSTLFNRVTASRVQAEDRLFATLDPTLRQLQLDGLGDVVLADTVGFIRDLPHSLVEAFKATLEEVVEADLLLHVIDASASDWECQVGNVHAVLEEIGARERPTLEVYNKIDRLDRQAGIERDAQGRPERVWVSAASGAGMSELREAIAACLGVQDSPVELLLSPKAGRIRAWLYDKGAVLSEQVAEDGRMMLRVKLDQDSLDTLADTPGVLLQGFQGLHRISTSP